jgi:predicted DNA-binding protein
MLDTMTPKKPPTASEAFPALVRIPVETRERLARVGAAMSKRALTELPASVVVRAAIDRGLDDLESELGIAKGKR